MFLSVLCSFRPRSFCELTTRFSLDVSDYHEEKHYFPLLMSVVVVTLCSTVLLYISFKHYTKKALTRHMESEAQHHRLQELKYVIVFTHTVICTIDWRRPWLRFYHRACRWCLVFSRLLATCCIFFVRVLRGL